MSKNQKLLLVLAILGAALWAALRFSSQNSQPPATTDNDTAVDMPLPAHSGKNTLPTPHTATPNSVAGANVPLLGPHLRKIGECLQIKNVLNDSAEMTFDAFNESVKNELGDLVSKEFDWKNVHVTLPNGEKRRIRMEVEALTEETSGIRLKYYGVDAEDLPVPLQLSEEQSWNPSEAFVASLEGEGKMTLREEAHRGLYAKGSELYYVERNGTLSELEITHHGKSVKCQNLQSPQGNCNCF